MFVSKHRLIPAVVACVVGLGAGAAVADDGSSQQQLQQRIDQLEAKVQTLQTQQSQNQADVTATIQKVIAQADAQSKLMDTENGGINYDAVHGLHFASDDGNFYMHPWALFQFQGIGTVTTSDKGDSAVQSNNGNSNTGFQIRHMEFGLEGHIVTPNLHYDLQMEAIGSAMTLEDAYAAYRLGDNSPFWVKAGQFEDFTFHEGIVDDAHQLAMDRSLVNALVGASVASAGGEGFSTDRDLGVAFVFRQDALRGQIALTNGYNSENAPFTGVPVAGVAARPENFGLLARGEWAIMGGEDRWREYDHFSSLGDKSDLLVVGTGAEWTEAEDTDAVQWTIDGQYNMASGLDIYGAFLSNFVTAGSNNAHDKNDFTDFGFLIQAGYMLNPQWEVFARYDFTILDKHDVFNAAVVAAGGKAETNVHEIDVGVNWYLYGQRVKATLQGAMLPTGSPVQLTPLGILADPRKFEAIGEAQLQILL